MKSSAHRGVPYVTQGSLHHCAVSSRVPRSQLLDCLCVEGNFSLLWCQNLLFQMSALGFSDIFSSSRSRPRKNANSASHMGTQFQILSKDGPFSSHPRQGFISIEILSLLKESSFGLHVSKSETIRTFIQELPTCSFVEEFTDK